MERPAYRIWGTQLDASGLPRACAADLNFGLDIIDGVAALHLKGDGFACQGFHEDLHVDGERPSATCPRVRSAVSSPPVDALENKESG